MFKNLYIMLVGALAFLLVGCNNKIDSNMPASTMAKEKVVIQIDVSTLPQDSNYTRRYINPDKIESIRAFIRELTWGDITNEKPDSEPGTEYIIAYTYDDNTKKSYYFKNDMYFKFDGIDWKVLGKFDALKEIILNNESD